MSLLNVTIGDKAPEIVNAIIEIPKDSQNKFEIDKATGLVMLDRVLYSPVHYPADYGFIPQTLSEDGDPLDIMVLGGDPLPSGCLLRARPVALLKMVDGGEQDNKVLAVQADNPRFDNVKDLADLNTFMPHLTKEISHFLRVYKELQNKTVEIQGWEDADSARAEIKRSQEMYKNK